MALGGLVDVVQLHTGAAATVVRANQQEDHRAVVVKSLMESPAPPAVRSRFRREFDVTSQLGEHPNIVRPLGWVDGADPAIVLDDQGGTALDRILADGPLDVADVLHVGIGVATALQQVHERDLVHRDVSPSNVCWNRTTGVVELIDFGLATTTPRRHVGDVPVRELVGTVAYMPPEQTGRMNRAVDSRSDLYGLGATLFHAVTGRRPFVGEEALDLVHAHLAKRPPSIVSLRPDVPTSLAAIVSRLLAKNPEDRYQTAVGLLRDLERCRELLAEGSDEEFELGAQDHLARLRLPDRLVGREEQLRELAEVLSRAAAGPNELVLVGGFSGIGKTRFVSELRPMVATRRGRFLTGKFDQFQRSTPYSAILTAIDAFAHQVLAEPEREVRRWSEALADAVGAHGRLLVDAVPVLARLLPSTPDPETLPPAEAEARFALLLRRVVSAMASAESPLVLFLDDLQWADLPSVKLLRLLVTDPAARHAVIVGAYRDNEVTAGDPLDTLADHVRAAGARVHEVELGPLGRDDVRDLVADAVGRRDAEAERLADVLLEHTGGNPHFLGEVLDELERSGIAHVGTDGVWRADLAAVRALPHSDEVAGFIAARLSTLPAAAVRLLALGAVLGPTFTLRDAASLADVGLREAADALDAAVRLGALSRVDLASSPDFEILDDLDATLEPRYAFAHDQVQLAASDPELLADGKLHLRIAGMLRRGDRGGSALFDLAEHVGEAVDLVADEDRFTYCTLVYRAATQARASAAFEPLVRYVDTAWELLDEPWTPHRRELTQAIALLGAEAAYLVGDEERMQSWITTILGHDADQSARLRAHEISITRHVARRRFSEAIDEAIEVLESIGVPMPAMPSQADLLKAVATTKLLLARRSSGDLAALPTCDDQAILAGMRILVGISSAAYYARPDLIPVIMTTLVGLSVRHGIGPESAYGFVGWGLVVSALGDLKGGAAMGRVASAMDDRLVDRRLHHRTRHLFHTHVAVWHQAWRTSRAALQDTHIGCWQGGDVEYAAFSGMMVVVHGFLTGDELGDLADRGAGLEQAIRSLSNEFAHHTLNMTRQLILSLRGDAEDPTRLVGPAYDGVEMTRVHEAAGDALNLFCQRTCEATLSLFLGEHERAAEVAAVARASEQAKGSDIFIAQLIFVHALAMALTATGPGDQGLVAAWRGLRRLRKWAGLAPQNHTARVHLVEAAIAAAQRRNGRATKAFELAVAAADEHGMLGDLALASELAARFHLRNGHAQIGRTMLASARTHYERWGATAKVARLDAEFPRLAAAAPAQVERSSVGTTTTASSTLDLDAMLSASAALLSQVEEAAVLEELLRLTNGVAGATRSVLLTVDDAGVVVQAEVNAADEKVVEIGRPLAESADLVAAGLVAYALRTRSEVVVDDVREDPRHGEDEVLRRRGVRSAMCMPVRQKGRVSALLYVENDLATHVFTPERVGPLQAIVVQAAISLENARLFESLEERVQQRSVELVEARQQAEQERDRADSILVNVLPEPIAAELKRTGRAQPIHVEQATVLFTDFVGFTSYATEVSPEELVAQLERCFLAFDEIMDRRGVTKLKTIGDSFMAVAGVPIPSATHARDVVLAGLDVLAWVEEPDDGEPCPFRVRVGAHTGPLVAGVIGKRRFLYDVWGDTVNIAARMESAGEAGTLNVSAQTAALVADEFDCVSRGRVQAKGKGEMEMFIVRRR